MKRLILAFALAFTLSSCGIGYYAYDTPVPVTGSINISLQPSWGPAGYDYAMYYYFPEFNFYYDVERAVFHYLNYGRWVSAKVLPHGRHFPADLHRYYKVVINHRNPWNYNRQHKNQYKHFKGVYNQRNLRDVRGNGPQHNNPRTEPPRRIHYQNSTPSRNNNTMRPGSGNRPGSQGNIGQDSTDTQHQYDKKAPEEALVPAIDTGHDGGEPQPQRAQQQRRPDDEIIEKIVPDVHSSAPPVENG